MKIYFQDCRRTPDGYTRIFHVFDQTKPFTEEAVILLGEKLGYDLIFPAPDRYSLLIICRDHSLPNRKCLMRRIRRHFARLVRYQILLGGIFNPRLPVRPYDAWYD